MTHRINDQKPRSSYIFKLIYTCNVSFTRSIHKMMSKWSNDNLGEIIELGSLYCRHHFEQNLSLSWCLVELLIWFASLKFAEENMAKQVQVYLLMTKFRPRTRKPIKLNQLQAA